LEIEKVDASPKTGGCMHALLLFFFVMILAHVLIGNAHGNELIVEI
jgi:hypothetical protein